MDKYTLKIIANIKSLKIQGATNVTLATLDLMEKVYQKNKTRQYWWLKKEMLKIGKLAAHARPTEPLAQNAVRFVLETSQLPFALSAVSALSVSDLPPKEILFRKIQLFKSIISDAKQKISILGAELIKSNEIYLTHCHSSTVVNLFKEAQYTGKKFTIYATETRPKMQGRLTAKDLLAAKIPVIFTADNAAAGLLISEKIPFSALFIGCDAITSEGNFLNKTGSLALAYAAHYRQIPVYVVATLWKTDPRPENPKLIEKRSPAELWPKPPPDLKIYNPAFELIPKKYITALICEKGVIQL